MDHYRNKNMRLFLEWNNISSEASRPRDDTWYLCRDWRSGMGWVDNFRYYKKYLQAWNTNAPLLPVSRPNFPW